MMCTLAALRLAEPFDLLGRLSFILAFVGAEGGVGAVVRDLQDVPEQPVVTAVPLRRGHDLLDEVVVDVGHEQRTGVAAALQERRLKHHAVLIAVDDLVLVLPPAERAVNEKLGPLRSRTREAGHKLPASVMRCARNSRDRPLASSQSLSSPGARRPECPRPSSAGAALLAGRCGRCPRMPSSRIAAAGHPELLDLDAAVALILRAWSSQKKSPEPQQ